MISSFEAAATVRAAVNIDAEGYVTVTLKGMSAVPAGSFVMGSDTHYPEERPAHGRSVDPFQVDQHPVTNAEFRRFVRATGYLTTAESVPDAADFDDVDPTSLVPGSLVFRPTDGPVPLDDWRRWWHWTPGASWRTPDGPGSTLHGRDLHPVVHVSFEDARAYAEWAGKDLLTEVEWEYAARAGAGPTTYAWGEDFTPKGRVVANTWHGRFPWENLTTAGSCRTTPVSRFPANAWGLHDMIGNVWEWTASPWTADHSGGESSESHSCCAPTRDTSVAMREEDRMVMKGGSHLCAPSYCFRYRPPARQGQAVRSSAAHLGFRCCLR